MDATEFLGLLLPLTGWIFTATNGTNGAWVNTAHKSIPSAVAHINTLTFQNKAAYFALATYTEERVWDPAWTNPEGEPVGKWRQRTQSNTKAIKSFFLDLDVDPADSKKFASKDEALAQLEVFVDRLGLPRPMLVDSGGGIHAYWPLDREVPTTEWRPVADQLKAACLAEKFRADASLTSDQARVLRCIGGFNFRRGAPVQLISRADGPYAFDTIAECLALYQGSVPAQTALSGAPAPSVFDDNLGAANDPIHFDRAVFHCAQLGLQVACRGAGVGEQLWRAGLGIAKFSEPQDVAYRAISDGHPDYNEAATVTKIANWRTGPTACDHFHMLNPAVCEACPHWKSLTSPAQLGHALRTAPEAKVKVVDESGQLVEVVIPPPPDGYTRTLAGGVKFGMENEEGLVDYETVCPYDFYPIRILRQHGKDHHVDERSVWRAHLPRVGAVDIDVPQSMISDHRRIYAHLLSKGVYLTPPMATHIQRYMSAYLQVLATHADRERLYEHLGWHGENNTTFVLGDRVLHRDGTTHAHTASKTIQAVTKEGVVPTGSLEAWKEAMAFYNRPGYEGHRFFLYAGFGAPLFHMNDTGNKGVLMTASGDSGRGKTTCLRACASIWGAPEGLILNGNKDGSTINALYETLGAFHSLPFLWDDITERDPDEIRRFLLNISQGKGKERMRGAEHSGHAVTWATIVLASANTDDVSRIMSSGKDVDPHLMRLVGVEFKAIDTAAEAKIAADRFLRSINQNYGHAGPMFIKFVVEHYESVARGYIKNVAMVDRKLNSSNASAERYWSATVAAAYTGAQIACRLGLLDYPYEADLEWMLDHLSKQRATIQESAASPVDILTEYLEHHIGNTLIVSAKQASNMDNVILRPYNMLLVRHEMDQNAIYISRASMMEHCTTARTSFRRVETTLEMQGILLARNVQKILGADTQYAKGQTRCWRIDASKLSQEALPTARIPTPAAP